MAIDYTTLITSQHADKTKFMTLVGVLTGAIGQITDQALALTAAFDLDLAIGVQLDAVGLWVGLSRQLLTPAPNVWFSFDTDGLAWDQANWQGPFDATEGVTSMDDDTYRAMLKAKIAANYWDGTNESLLLMAATALQSEGVSITVDDDLNMSVDNIYVIGTGLTALLQAMLKRGIFPPKPAGVQLNGYFASSFPGAPLFALDASSSFAGGLDIGAWSVSF